MARSIPRICFAPVARLRLALAKLDRKQIVVIRSSVLPSIFDECGNIR